jgi:hypothetical protein
MKNRLDHVIELVQRLRDDAHDDELTDELDNALLHLDAAHDRLVAMDEEEDDDA